MTKNCFPNSKCRSTSCCDTALSAPAILKTKNSLDCFYCLNETVYQILNIRKVIMQIRKVISKNCTKMIKLLRQNVPKYLKYSIKNVYDGNYIRNSLEKHWNVALKNEQPQYQCLIISSQSQLAMQINCFYQDVTNVSTVITQKVRLDIVIATDFVEW